MTIYVRKVQHEPIRNTLKSCIWQPRRVNPESMRLPARTLFTTEQPITLEAVKKLMESESEITPPWQVNIDDVDLGQYDQLLKTSEVAYGQQA